MSSIFEFVKEDVQLAVSRFGDGTQFFDYLDERLIAPAYFDYLKDRIVENHYDGILGSGKFGWAFSMYAASHPFLPPVYNFPGDLRHQDLYDPMIDPHFEGAAFVYIDNSIYKGRTLGKVNRYVRDWGGRIKAAFVLYDGSRPPHAAAEIVTPFHYIYRWHDGGYRALEDDWQVRPGACTCGLPRNQHGPRELGYMADHLFEERKP